MKFKKIKPRKLKRIQNELSSYTYLTILKFIDLFPLASDKYTMHAIKLVDTNNFCLKLAVDEPCKDFWARWNRFKQLRAFL